MSRRYLAYTIYRSTTCWLPAACFIRPRNALHVAVILKVVTFLEARFAVRSGGHNPNAGFASVDQSGVLIDLQDLRTLDMQNDEKEVVTIGTGARWGQVYEYLDNRSLGIVGGRDVHIGVGGLLLGGEVVRSRGLR
jgi:FAD/FMN-containing dehydrogenase